MAQRPPNPLSNVGVNRLGELRKHGERLRARLQHADVRVLPLCGGRVCVVGTVAASLGADTIDPEDAWLLGEADGVTYLALDVASETWDSLPLPTEAALAPLRDVAALLTPLDGNLLAMAAGLAAWHATSRFCGSCGAPTRSEWSGHRRVCTDCAREHFPRTDPAVIVLVTAGDAVLLGRNPAWPPGFSSVLAGFVEPGESLEDCVAREVREESGVTVDPDSITYHSSQPWPFPASLMLGFTARALTRELDPDPEELADACWHTREEVAHGAVGLPPPLSISRRLIDDWLAGDSTG